MSYAMPRHHRDPSHAYAHLGLETRTLSASPTRLITLLFEGARSALAQARCGMAANNIAARGLAISKAIDIVENGLKASLDMKAGGTVASSLQQAYDLIVKKLLLANLKSDTAQLEAAERLLADIAAAWCAAVDPQANTQANPQTASQMTPSSAASAAAPADVAPTLAP